MATTNSARAGRPGGSYFESWHYFLTGKDGAYLLVAPGYVRSGEGAFAFIQLGQAEGATFFEYDPSRLSVRARPFSARIDDSVFSEEGMSLSIESEVVDVHGEVAFSAPVRYKRAGLGDPFGGAGGMPARHEIVLLRAACAGAVDINGKKIDFSGGSLYLDKCRGAAFAKTWLWAEASSFPGGGALALSVLFDERPGLPRSRIAACVHDGGLQRSLARDARIVEFRANRESAALTLEDAKLRLSVEMSRGPLLNLKAPEAGFLARAVSVSLEARIKVLLEERGGRRLFEGDCPLGALSLSDSVADFLRGMVKG